MGQIRGKNAHIDACNLRSLSSFGTPAAGQHILVSTDNSATADGQGNFDCYVVGDGTTAATALKIRKKDDELTRMLALANCAKVYNVTINNNLGTFAAYSGGISVIYPLEGSGKVSFTAVSGVSHNVKLLSDDTVVLNQSAHIVANVVAAGTTYDTTSKFLYVQLLQGTDRTPAAIYVNGYDIIKDIRSNVDSLISRVAALETGLPDGSVSTAKLADGSVTFAKLASNSVGVAKLADNAAQWAKRTKTGSLAALLTCHAAPPLQFNTNAKTLTIKGHSRIMCGLNLYNTNPWDDDIVLDITNYRNGVLLFDTTSGVFNSASLVLVDADTSGSFSPMQSNQNIVVICSWTTFGALVNASSSYSVNGSVYGILNGLKIPQVGLLGNHNFKNFMQFTLNSTTKSLLIKQSTRIFYYNQVVMPAGSLSADTTIDLSVDYEGNALTYGGILCYNNTTSSPSWRVYPHSFTGSFDDNDIIIAYFNFKPSVSCPSSYFLNGNELGITQKLPLPTICPTFDTITLPSGITWWSDFIPMTINGVDELWLFKYSSDEVHTASDGKIFRVKMSDWTLVGTITHNFGHCNTCHYDAANDVLLIANLPGNTQYPSALYLFYNVSSWASESTLDFNNVAKAIVNIQTLGFGGNTSAFFAENGFGRRNQVYVMTSIDATSKLCKIVLGMGANQLTYGTYNSAATDSQYNGTFDIVLPIVDYANPSDFDSNKNVVQGGDYARGRIITTNGHDQLFGYIWNVTNLNGENAVERTMIESIPRKANGAIDYCVAEGLCVKDGYVYQGIIKISNDFRETYSVEGFYLAKYPLPY